MYHKRLRNGFWNWI